MRKLSLISKATTGALAAACWAHVMCGLLQARPADCGSRTAEGGSYYYGSWQNSGWSQGGPAQHPTADEAAAVSEDDPPRPQWHHQTRHVAGAAQPPHRPLPATIPETAAAAIVDSADPFPGDRGGASQLHGRQRWWTLVGAPGLLRLVSGQAAAEWDPAALYGAPLPPPLPSYALCGRVAAVGRLVARVAEPLFATGFFVAASYFFRTSLLPRLARRVHAYAAALTTQPDGGDCDDARSGHGYGGGGGSWPFARLRDALAAGVRDAVDDDAARPCLQRMACEAVLRAASNPIARSVQRMAERILLKSELSNIFNKLFTGSVSECNQYSCEHQ